MEEEEEEEMVAPRERVGRKAKGDWAWNAQPLSMLFHANNANPGL